MWQQHQAAVCSLTFLVFFVFCPHTMLQERPHGNRKISQILWFCKLMKKRSPPQWINKTVKIVGVYCRQTGWQAFQSIQPGGSGSGGLRLPLTPSTVMHTNFTSFPKMRQWKQDSVPREWIITFAKDACDTYRPLTESFTLIDGVLFLVPLHQGDLEGHLWDSNVVSCKERENKQKHLKWSLQG